MTLPIVGVEFVTRGFDSYSATFRRANQLTSEYERTVRGLQTTTSNSFDRIGRSGQQGTSAIVSGFNTVGSAARSVIPLIAGVAAAVGGFRAAVGTISVGAGFEQSIADLGAVTRATDAEMEGLSETIRGVARTSSSTASQTAEAANALALAGFEISDIQVALQDTINLAAAAPELDVQQAADFASNILSGFGLESAELESVVDQLVATSTRANTNVTDLAQALSFAAPDARQLGVDVATTTALIGALADSGIGATRAGTSLRRVFANLQSPVAQAAEAMDELGINVFTAEGEFLGITNILRQFEQATGDLTDEARGDVLGRIFDANSLSAFNVLMARGADNIEQFAEETRQLDLENIATTTAERRLETFNGQVLLLQSAFEDLQISVSELVLPSLTTFVSDVLTPGVIELADFTAGVVDLRDAFQGVGDFEFDLGTLGLEGSIERLGEQLQVDLAGFVNLTLTPEVTELSIGDFFAFRQDEEQITLNVSDFFTFEQDLESTTIDLAGLVTFTGTPEGFEIDTSGLVTFAGEVSTFVIDLANLVTFAGQATITELQLPETLSEGLTSLGSSLGTVDEALSGLVGDGGPVSEFTDLVNMTIAGLTTSLEGVDAEAAGAAFTSIVTSLLGIITTLNTIDDVAISGVASSLSELSISILNFATDFTTAVDAEAVGEVAANSAADFISSFGLAFSEPDIPGIGVAAAGLVAGIGIQFREAFGGDQLSVVGATFGQLAQTILEQLTSTLSDPAFGTQIGEGLSNLLIGITEGLTAVISGFNEEFDDSDAQIGTAVTDFVSNLISALATGLAEADYGSLAAALVTGIGASLTGGLFNLTSGPRESNDEIVEGLRARAQGVDVDELIPAPSFSLSDVLLDTGGVTETIAQFNRETAAQLEQSELEDAASRAGQALDDLANGIDVAGLPALIGELTALGEVDLAQNLIDASVAASDLQMANQAAAESLQTADDDGGILSGISNFVGSFFGPSGAPEAERTGGFAPSFGSEGLDVQEQIAQQLSSIIPEGETLDIAGANTALVEAVQMAIPAATEDESITGSVVTAITDSIPETIIAPFPGWERIIQVPRIRIPRFIGWRRLFDDLVPDIPDFGSWSDYVRSIDFAALVPAFPGWEGLVAPVDLAALVPAFPGWDAFITPVQVPSGGGGGGGNPPDGGTGSGPGFDPGFQFGTESAPGGLALVGEGGPELALLPPVHACFPTEQQIE